MPKRTALCLATVIATLSRPALAQEIENWPAPPYWTPPPRAAAEQDRGVRGLALEVLPSSPVPFVAIAPCRLLDTRNNVNPLGGGGPFGTDEIRTYTLPGACGLPSGILAVSLNVTATNTGSGAFGHVKVWPADGTEPNVSTLNYPGAGATVANAAVVPLSGTGAMKVKSGNASADVILDVNGYYSGSVVTRLNTLSGDVTLAPGANTSITPSGQTLTIASTAAGLPAGSANQTLRHNGTSWVASGALTNDATDVGLTGTLALPSEVRVTAGGSRFLHNHGFYNTFLGYLSGNLSTMGAGNTAIGQETMVNVTTGNGNTAVGSTAMQNTTVGTENAAVGDSALESGNGSFNSAFGAFSLVAASTGSHNVALGRLAGSALTTGSNNIIIGSGAGNLVTTGSNNIYIGHPGATGAETGQIRIGNGATITTGTVIVGIYGFGSVGGIPVIVNSGGRLGTTTSSARYKDAIRDLGEESAGLMDLRPVAFKYKPEHDQSGLTQYGLIAEEVAEIYPELVAYDEEGRPQAIRSQLLDPLLINELQKQHRTIQGQKAEIEELKARLAKLEQRSSIEPGR